MTLRRHFFTTLTIIIVLVGLYLRYYHIEQSVSFGWDQGRDAWVIRDILQGKLTWDGPRTGVGHFHLGPIYFYLVAPFIALTHLDPVGTIYFNILANIVNFTAIFFVIKKMLSFKAALLGLFIYSFSQYTIHQSQIPWNVSLVPATAAVFMYVLYRISQGKYQLIPLLFALQGFFFHLHFTAVFLPIPIFFTFLISPHKTKIIKYSLFSLPIILLFLLPNIIAQATQYGRDVYAFRDFMKYYFVGIHPRFFLYRLPDSLIQFDAVLFFDWLKWFKYIFLILFILITFLNKTDRKMGLIVLFMFLSMILGFGIYGGPVSDYYYLLTLPAVLVVLSYLQMKLVKVSKIPAVIFLAIIGVVWFFQNTKDSWIKPEMGGLAKQKIEVRDAIDHGRHIDYTEGDIKAYLYTIAVEGKTNF